MGENKPLRKQMTRVMLILAIVPLALLVIGGSVLIGSLIRQNERDTQAVFDEMQLGTYYGFIQNEQYQHDLMIEIACSMLPQDVSHQQALDEILPVFDDGTDNVFPIDAYMFFADGDKIIAAKGRQDIAAAELQELISGTIAPALPAMHPNDPSLQSLEALLTEHRYGRYFPATPSETSFLLTWRPLEGNMKLGIFSSSTISESQTQLVVEFIEQYRAESAQNIRSILLSGGIAFALVIAVLISTILYFSKKLSTNVSAPVERREREQDELLRRSEEEKALLESLNQMKTEFLSNVSHELKTPLTVISSHMQVGQQKLAGELDAGDIDRRMQLVSGEAERMALMVGQLLDVGRIDEGRMLLDQRPEPVMDMIQSTLNTYYPVFSKNGNELRFLPDGELPPVLCDRMRFIQVLVNLIGNASKHTLDGEITVSVCQQDGFAAISVSDTGEGIPAERLPYLFDRYNSRRSMDRSAGSDTGTGLGLFICKYIVEAHGGSITVESKPGEGTTVTFTVPIAQ